MQKYLLCCPYGGYNDQISVIYHCYIYCQQVGRTLLLYTNCIDKNEEIDDGIQNTIYTFDLNKYIHFELENFISDKETIENILENIQDNDILQYMPIYDLNIPKKLKKYIRYDTQDENLVFLSRDYLFYNFEHKLMCYYNCGGNYDLDINYLNKFFFKEQIKTLYEDRKKLLPENYVSFHIRNTDYNCDYKKIFEEYENLLEFPIYLATDSVEVLKYVKSIAKKEVYQFSILHNENKPLHLKYFGFITIPLLSLIALTLITLSMFVYAKMCTKS
jgi:hypothetical protein